MEDTSTLAQKPVSNPARRFILLRLGLIGSGVVVLQTAAFFWVLTDSFRHPIYLALSAASWLIGIACFVLAMVTLVPRWSQYLILIGLIGSLWSMAHIGQINYTPLAVSHSDSEMISEFAAEALKRGYNPYTWNFSDHTRVYRDPGYLVTTFLNGAAQNRVSYPALPTLNLIAFDFIGLGGVRNVNLIFHTILLVLLFVGSPERYRPIILLPIFIVKAFTQISLGGIQDIVWSTLLVAMVLSWKRPAVRAVLFGLACAYRQQPWFVAPFILIYLWHQFPKGNLPHASLKDIFRQPGLALRDPRVGSILYFSTISFGIFTLINLPFIIWDMQAWFLGVFEHVYAVFNVYSHGLGALSQHNLLALPREFYTFLQLSSLAIMLIVHWRHPGAIGNAFWIFPGIYFFLYYRGLSNYWLYWIPPLLMAIARTDWHLPGQINSGKSWRKSLNLIAVILACNLLWGVFLLQRQPTITANLHYPIEAPVSRLDVSVKNMSEQILHPRFAVQRGGNQPIPWIIDKGVDRLKPGESDQYTILAPSLLYDFSPAHGAQVVISNAGNDYQLRAVLDVPIDTTFSNPDAIINPSFAFWSSASHSPKNWTWFVSEGKETNPGFAEIDGRPAVVLSVEEGFGRLNQFISFPSTFTIWVRPAITGSDPLQSAYGLEFLDGRQRLWVLFGDREGSDLIEEDHAVVYLKTPLNQWSQQNIDLEEFYTRFGWELPGYSIRNRQGIEFATRQVSFSLLVSGRQVRQAFGAIEQDLNFASPKNLMAEAISHPDNYYLNLGNEYVRQRNFDLAMEAYQRALEYNPANTEAQEKLRNIR